MTKLPIFFGYARKSRIDPNNRQEIESTDRQVARLQAWAAEQGVELELYAEPDGYRSGGSIEHRPAYQQMLQRLRAVRPGEVAGIVATDLDRAGRLERDMHDLFDEVVARGLRLVVLDEPTLNLESTDGRFLAGLKVLLAAQERRKVSDRIRSAVQYRMSRGYFHGRLPYGYRWADATSDAGHSIRVLEPEPVEAERIRAIFHKYLEGTGTEGIARWCNALGWTTKRGMAWTGGAIYHTVEHVLTYRGCILVRDADQHITGVFEGKHPPLIDEALAEAVQAAFRTRTSANRGGRRSQMTLPLVHLVWCQECGTRIVSQIRLHEKGRPIAVPVPFYRCPKSRGPCGSGRVPAQILEAQVWAELLALRDDILARADELDDLADTVSLRLPEPSAVGAVRAEMERLNTMYRKGRISEAAYDRDYEELERRLTYAEASIATIGSRRDPLGIVAFLKVVAEIEEAIASGDRNALTPRVQGVIERVEVYRGKVVLCRFTPLLEQLRAVFAS